jgi:hypothetical protein
MFVLFALLNHLFHCSAKNRYFSGRTAAFCIQTALKTLSQGHPVGKCGGHAVLPFSSICHFRPPQATKFYVVVCGGFSLNNLVGSRGFGPLHPSALLFHFVKNCYTALVTWNRLGLDLDKPRATPCWRGKAAWKERVPIEREGFATL